VSLFRFLRHPQLDPFSRSPHPLSPLSTAFLPRAKPRGTPSSTVSPLSTAFLPRVKPRGTPTSTLSPLATAFTPNRPLTPLSTAFTQKHRGGVPSYPKSSQWLATADQAVHPKALTPFRMNTCKSVSKQKTLSTCTMNTYAKTGGRGAYLCDCSSALRVSAPSFSPRTFFDSRAAGVRWCPSIKD
jgi:hypothetical protein